MDSPLVSVRGYLPKSATHGKDRQDTTRKGRNAEKMLSHVCKKNM